MNESLSHASASLPESFSFYGFGAVARSREAEKVKSLADILTGKAGVSFRLLGDPAVLLIVLFDSSLDVSMYTEMGNILASKLCKNLSEQGEGDLMITPPLMLGSEQLAKLLRTEFPFIHRSYEHVNQDQSVLIETLILPVFVNGASGAEEHIGNA